MRGACSPLMMGFTRRSRRSKESPTAGLATRQPSVSCSLCNDIESLLDRWLHTARLHHSHKLVSLETAPSRAAPGLSNTVAYRQLSRSLAKHTHCSHVHRLGLSEAECRRLPLVLAASMQPTPVFPSPPPLLSAVS